MIIESFDAPIFYWHLRSLGGII